MPIGASQMQQVQSAATTWARHAGFSAVKDVPFLRAPEMIDAVAKETKLSPAKVRDALLEAAAAANDKGATGLDSIGGEGRYEGGAVHTPLKGSDGGVRPMGALIDARSKTDTPVIAEERTAELSSLNEQFKQTSDDFAATRVVVTRKATPKTLKELNEACAKLLMLFNQLDGSRNDKQTKQEIIKLYKDLLSDKARDKGVFLTKSTEEHPVTSFRLADKKDAALPDAPGHTVGKDGLGLGSSVGVDAASGQPFVFDYQGQVTEIAGIGEFVLNRKTQFQTDAQADKLAQEPKALESLRSVSDKALERVGGKVEHVSINDDDPAGLTHVYATKWLKEPGSLLSRRLVVDGPFKGIFLDDLVNELATRRGEGTSFDPQVGKRPAKVQHGEPMVTTTTVKERGEEREKLYIRVPQGREWTEVRRSLRRLSELEPSVKYKDGTGNTAFLFGPENYKLVRDIVGGMVLAGPATKLLETHFDELTKVEVAASDKSLVNHTAKAIGGFKTGLKGADGKEHEFQLSYWQKKSLAWLEARDHKGVIALDTGMGKTLVAIGMMQELRNKENEKRPFLYVGPPGLGGNMSAEIFKFCEPKVAEELNKKLQVMDYKEFAKACRTGEHDGKPFKAEGYGAVFFDEAQWIKKRTSVGGNAALAFKHPHKVVLTKSVMKDSIDDAFTLACIANNVNLNDAKEGKESRYLMRKFRTLHCNVVGGRTVGVKEAVELTPGNFVDPKHNMHAFIKANFLHADKRVDDVKLPQFQLSAETLTMPPKMEEAYRAKSKAIGKLMRGMVSLYRDQGISKTYVDDKGRTRHEVNPLAKNKKIAEMFGTDLRKLIGEINDLSNTPAKIDRAADIVWKHIEDDPSARAVLFSDSATYVVQTALDMSKKIPGKVHAACLGKEIKLFQDGKELKEFKGFKVPFTAQEYTDAASGRKYGTQEWQKFVLDKVIGPQKDVASTTLFGPVYQEGQNLQWANVGIHLDRDTWSRQNTEQREGRIWRKGQEEKVSFYNIDWVYKKPKDDLDRTLDEVRGLYEKVDGQLFHDVIVVPQKLELGGEWAGVREREDMRLDTTVLEYALDPSIKAAAEKGGFA